MNRRAATTLVALVLGVRGLCAVENPVVVGDARFTVITPECIRIEYAPGGKFIDAKSLFAVERNARLKDFKLERKPEAVTIDTGAIRLLYKPDGQPFSPSNLKAEIRKGGETVTWTPGAPNPGNLGGTIRTLDGVVGPVDLGEGLLSRDGWYLIDDSRTPLFTDKWVESRPGNSGTDWYLFGYGDDYKAALKSLITIGGRAPVPRRYTLGIWFSRYWPFTSEDYRKIIREYHENDFPLDIIVMDMDWHRDGWTGWSWNRELIPDPKALLRWFHEQGLQVTLNLHPADGVGPHEDRYKEFMRALGENPSSRETVPFDAGSEKYVKALLDEILKPLQEDGVDFWWLDWQQYPFTRSIPDLTNLFWLNKILFDSTTWNGDRGISFSRWAGWGDHRHVIQFSGDADTGWPMLAFEIPFTSTAGNVGCYYWSHDIGGHQGPRNEESYTRWTQFGAMSTALRSHSTRDEHLDRRPWLYEKWAEDSMRIAFHLRAEILPYVYSSAWQTFLTGVSLNRPLYLEYPEREEAYHNGQEFLFGDNLLVAPITMPGVGPGRVGRQTVWFPPGDTWFNFFTGEKFEGDQTRIVSADINEFPLYVRGGVPIPMQRYSERPGTAVLDTLRLRCYPGKDGVAGQYILHEDDGHSGEYLSGKYAATPLRYTRQGDRVVVEIGATKGTYKGQPAKRGYEIELANTVAATDVTIDGRPAKAGYDATLGVSRIVVPPSDIRKPIRIEATAPEIDATKLANAAQARRARGIVGDAAGSKSLEALLNMDSLSRDEKEALLALEGVGLMPYHESPTFFGEKKQFAFLAPAGLLEGNTVQKIVDDEAGEHTETVEVGKGPILLDGNRYGRVEFRIAGRDYSVATTGLPVTGNIARKARVSASSSENGHAPEAAVDGLIGGYPDSPEQEWSANRETTGARLELAWDEPQEVSRIILFDRPNLVDQVTSATIRFSDGSTIEVGELPNDASKPVEVTFPAKSITGLTVEITGVRQGTENAGFAEIAVY